MNRKPKKPSLLEDPIKALAKCGVTLRSGMTLKHLLEIDGLRDYEETENKYFMLLMNMGFETVKRPAGRRLSDNIWYVDVECIYDSNDYVEIARRMRDLAGGDLPIRNIRARLDWQKGTGSLSFGLDSKQTHWNIKVDKDWVDEDVFVKFQRLLASRKSCKQYTYLENGQYFFIGCATPSQLKQLRKTTSLPFTWLRSRQIS